MGRVRDWLKTEDQRALFDFTVNPPLEFALKYAGIRWTEEHIADHLKIPVERIPSIKKAIRRAYSRQLGNLHIER